MSGTLLYCHACRLYVCGTKTGRCPFCFGPVGGDA